MNETDQPSPDRQRHRALLAARNEAISTPIAVAAVVGRLPDAARAAVVTVLMISLVAAPAAIPIEGLLGEELQAAMPALTPIKHRPARKGIYAEPDAAHRDPIPDWQAWSLAVRGADAKLNMMQAF